MPDTMPDPALAAPARAPLDLVPAQLPEVLGAALANAAGSCRPLFLRLRRCPDRETLLEALRALPRVRVFDSLDRQFTELQRRTRGSASFPGTAPAPSDSGPQGGLWAFYPWNAHLLHLLPPEQFARLRSVADAPAPRPPGAVSATLRVGLLGLRAQHLLAVALASERVFGHIRLADPGNVEMGDLERLGGALHCIGLPRALVVAREVAERDPYVSLDCHAGPLDAAGMDRFLAGAPRLDIVFDSGDDPGVSRLLRQRAAVHAIPVPDSRGAGAAMPPLRHQPGRLGRLPPAQAHGHA